MRNVFFKKEILLENDLYFICSMVGLIARNIKQLNESFVNKNGNKGFVCSYYSFQFISIVLLTSYTSHRHYRNEAN